MNTVQNLRLPARHPSARCGGALLLLPARQLHLQLGIVWVTDIRKFANLYAKDEPQPTAAQVASSAAVDRGAPRAVAMGSGSVAEREAEHRFEHRGGSGSGSSADRPGGRPAYSAREAHRSISTYESRPLVQETLI